MSARRAAAPAEPKPVLSVTAAAQFLSVPEDRAQQQLEHSGAGSGPPWSPQDVWSRGHGLLIASPGSSGQGDCAG